MINLNNKIQVTMASIISFTIGAFTVNYFNNNSQQKITLKTYRTENDFRRNEKVVSDNESSQVKASNFISNLKESLNKESTTAITGKKIDYITLSAQVESFQDVIREKVKSKFKMIYSSDISKKGNADKKYILESNLNEMFSEKKVAFKGSVRATQKNEQIIVHYTLTDCDRYEKAPVSTKMEDACFYMSLYTFINNKWYKTSMGGSYSSAEWMGDQPYAMFFTEYTQDLMKATSSLRFLVPIPTKSGKMHSLKYIDGELVWEQGGEIEWQHTTEKEIKDFAKYVEKYMQELANEEE